VPNPQGSGPCGAGAVSEEPEDRDTVEALEATAKAIVLRQLAAGPRTRAQLTERLRRRGVPEEVREDVLDRFEDVHLVDDTEFARMWVESRHTGRGLARRALGYELRVRGIAEERIRDAVDVISTEDELESARELVRKQIDRRPEEEETRRFRRLAAMLTRKGYSPETVRRAVVDVTGSWHDEW
jgi:regulatory protein